MERYPERKIKQINNGKIVFLLKRKDRQQPIENNKIKGKISGLLSWERFPAIIPAINDRKIKNEAGFKGLKNVFTSSHLNGLRVT